MLHTRREAEVKAVERLYAAFIGPCPISGMKTHGHGSRTVFCKCGAVYRDEWINTPTREPRHFDCKCCGRLLYEWTNSQDNNFFLLERPAGQT